MSRTIRCLLLGCTPTFRWSAPHIVCSRCLQPYRYAGRKS